jgi:hypothetical protein
VTYEDGSLIPAEEMQLVFTSQTQAIDVQTAPRPGTAIVKVADGTFDSVMTYEYGDGVIPGKHKVAVQPMKDGMPIGGLVPAAYMDPRNTLLEVTVEAGGGPLELKVPKP